MAFQDRLASAFSALNITPASTVSHAETTSPAAWRETLVANESSPKTFELIKTLVYKPKTAKSATPVPVVVIARDETETNTGAIAKLLNLKELRLASEDLLTEFFSLDKNSRTSLVAHLKSISNILISVSPLAIDSTTFSKVITVLDPSIAESSSLFAVHAFSSSNTVFLSGKDIAAHLKSLETTEIKVVDLDTTAPSPAAVAQTSKPPVKEKEDAKIEGAVQIAIGVKKEVDFPGWYTNVRLPWIYLMQADRVR